MLFHEPVFGVIFACAYPRCGLPLSRRHASTGHQLQLGCVGERIVPVVQLVAHVKTLSISRQSNTLLWYRRVTRDLKQRSMSKKRSILEQTYIKKSKRIKHTLIQPPHDAATRSVVASWQVPRPPSPSLVHSQSQFHSHHYYSS